MGWAHQFAATSVAASTAGEAQSSDWNSRHWSTVGTTAGSTGVLPEVLTRTFNVVSTNSSAVSTLINYSVPARTLGTNRMLRWTGIGTKYNGSTATSSNIIEVQHAGSSRWKDGSPAQVGAVGDVQPWMCQVIVAALNSSGSRFLNGKVLQSSGGAATFGIGNLLAVGVGDLRVITQFASSAVYSITTGVAESFIVQYNWGVANSSRDFRMYYSVLELI